MALQKVFSKSYADYLRNHINVENYLQESFDYDQTQVHQLYGITHPEGLLEKLDPTQDGDLQTAIAIFEAYPGLTPQFAQQDDLWVYLTHVDLFDYVKKRWPIKDKAEEDTSEKHILNHWHRHPTHFLRTTFAGFWWNVYLTIDEQREDKYELTKTLFNAGLDFRTLRFGELSMIRYRESMIGILEFLLKNPEVYESCFVARGQYISRYFNMIGGTKQLTALDRTFFMNELEKKKDTILSIKSVDDIHNKDIHSFSK